MGACRLPAPVEARILALLDECARRFGEAARNRYAALIVQAMQDAADAPRRRGAKSEPNIDRIALFRHLGHSRDQVGSPPGRVCRPRHVLVCEPAADGTVDILGLIPDIAPAVLLFIPER